MLNKQTLVAAIAGATLVFSISSVLLMNPEQMWRWVLNADAVEVKVERALTEKTSATSLLEHKLSESTTEIDILTQKLANIKNEQFSSSKLIALIEKLDPAESMSEDIRKIQQKSNGPWSRFSASKEIIFSVPGAQTETRTYRKIVYGCNQYINKKLQIISNFEHSKGRTIEVTVNGTINNASNCKKLVGVDIQLDCNSAAKLLTSEILKCDAAGNPLWSENMRTKVKKFPAYAVVRINGT